MPVPLCPPALESAGQVWPAGALPDGTVSAVVENQITGRENGSESLT